MFFLEFPDLRGSIVVSGRPKIQEIFNDLKNRMREAQRLASGLGDQKKEDVAKHALWIIGHLERDRKVTFTGLQLKGSAELPCFSVEAFEEAFCFVQRAFSREVRGWWFVLAEWLDRKFTGLLEVLGEGELALRKMGVPEE